MALDFNVALLAISFWDLAGHLEQLGGPRLQELLRVLPAAVFGLNRWSAYFVTGAAVGGLIGAFRPIDRMFNQDHPFVQRIFAILNHAAFGVLFAFCGIFVLLMISPLWGGTF